MKFVFSDEKMFNIDGVYNSQNARIWAVNRNEADANGGIKQVQKFPQKVMAWLPKLTATLSEIGQERAELLDRLQRIAAMSAVC